MADGSTDPIVFYNTVITRKSIQLQTILASPFNSSPFARLPSTSFVRFIMMAFTAFLTNSHFIDNRLVIFHQYNGTGKLKARNDGAHLTTEVFFSVHSGLFNYLGIVC